MLFDLRVMLHDLQVTGYEWSELVMMLEGLATAAQKARVLQGHADRPPQTQCEPGTSSDSPDPGVVRVPPAEAAASPALLADPGFGLEAPGAEGLCEPNPERDDGAARAGEPAELGP